MVRALLLATVATLASAASAAAGEPRWRFDAEASYSDLSHGLTPWREGALRAVYRVDGEFTLGAAVEAASRFGNFDAYFEVRADARTGSGTSVYALAGGTPDADFRPRNAFGLGGAQRLFQDDGFVAAVVATLDLRYADYAAGDVESANPGIEIYLLHGRAWITARHINIWDETNTHRTGYILRTDVQPAENFTVFAGYADAPDTSDGVTVDTTSWFAGAAVDVDTTTTVRLALAQEMRDSGYDRTTVTLSLTLKR